MEVDTEAISLSTVYLSILLKYIHLSVHQISPKPLHLQSWISHIVYALPRQRRHSFQNKFYCPFDQFYFRQFKRIGTPSTPNIAQINNLVLLSDRSLCIILFSPLIRINAVAQRLECATDTRVFTGSNHAEVVWNLFQFPSPHLILPVFFGRDSTVLAMCNYRQCSKLFQDFSLKFTLIVWCMHSFNHSTSACVNGEPIHSM